MRVLAVNWYRPAMPPKVTFVVNWPLESVRPHRWIEAYSYRSAEFHQRAGDRVTLLVVDLNNHGLAENCAGCSDLFAAA